MESPQYIYLLQEREFIKTNENIYKIGKTTQQNNERFKQYPKGSILLLQSICSDCHLIEKELIKLFKENFKQRNDIGTEYFEGDLSNMIHTIIDLIKNDHLIINKCDKIKSITEQEDIDKYNPINEFILHNIKLYNEGNVNVYKLYDLFKEWWSLTEDKKCPSLHKFKDIINNKFGEEISYDDYTWKGIAIINHESDNDE
jgi:hypothetical protein